MDYICYIQYEINILVLFCGMFGTAPMVLPSYFLFSQSQTFTISQ